MKIGSGESSSFSEVGREGVKRSLAESIEMQTKDFLKKGGKIERVEFGVISEDNRYVRAAGSGFRLKLVVDNTTKKLGAK